MFLRCSGLARLKGFFFKKSDVRDMGEALIALLLSTIGDAVTGFIFGLGSRILRVKPEVIVLIPATTDMRGNIYASLGSRLGTLLHSGMLDSRLKKSKSLMDNVISSIVQSLNLSLFIGVISALYVQFTFSKGVPHDLILISMISSIFSMPIMITCAIIVALSTFRRGWDPDNFSAPILTLLGDFITLPLILISTLIVLNLHFYMKVIIGIILIIVSMAGLTYIAHNRRKMSYMWRILIESLPICMASGVLSLISGIILEKNMEKLLLTAGLFTILPAFLEEGGAISGILAAKFSTKLHLGELEGKLKFSREVLKEFLKMYVISPVIFSLTAILGFIMSSILHLPMVKLDLLIPMLITAGLLLVTIGSVTSYLVAVLSFRKGLDPDNTTIPVLTSIMDVSGALSLIVSLTLYGTF